MCIVFILLKAPVTAKVLNNYLETSGMSRRDSVFSPATINSTVLTFCPSPLIVVSGLPQETEMVGGSWPAGLGQGRIESPIPAPGAPTWVSGTMEFCPGVALKKVDNGEEMMIGSGRTKPLRSQLGMEFSSVFITRVSMA